MIPGGGDSSDGQFLGFSDSVALFLNFYNHHNALLLMTVINKITLGEAVPDFLLYLRTSKNYACIVGMLLFRAVLKSKEIIHIKIL